MYWQGQVKKYIHAFKSEEMKARLHAINTNVHLCSLAHTFFLLKSGICDKSILEKGLKFRKRNVKRKCYLVLTILYRNMFVNSLGIYTCCKKNQNTRK